MIMKHADLKTRLNVRLLLTLLAFGLVFSVSLNYYLRALMENNVTDKTRLIFANLLAVQTYVRETLRPVMVDTLPKDSFVIEAMSTSYVTRKVMSDLNMAGDQFTYRRVALEPRNTTYAANEMERDFIEHFQHNPSENILSRFRMIGDQECYVSARPVVFRQNCLVCHGNPEDAPIVMLTRYGSERGFGRKEGEIGGLDMLIVPVQGDKVAIQRVTISFVVVLPTLPVTPMTGKMNIVRYASASLQSAAATSGTVMTQRFSPCGTRRARQHTAPASNARSI